MKKKERKEYKKILKEYNSVRDYEYDEEEDEEHIQKPDSDEFIF